MSLAFKAFFGFVLGIIAAAKHHRLERELRIYGPRQDWLRIDDDNFTAIDHSSLFRSD